MTDVISNIVTDKQDIKNQLGTVPDVLPLVKRFGNNLSVKRVAIKIVETSLDGSMIWGHTTLGIWGTSEWGKKTTFILNHPEFGVLGANNLGKSGFSTIHAVVPEKNIFTEYFGQASYIHPSKSTGTLDAVAETYTLAAGQILESEVVAKIRQPINSCQFVQHSSVDITTGDIVEFSNDSGVTWVTATSLDEPTIFASSSVDDELVYKITSTNGIVIDSPLALKIN